MRSHKVSQDESWIWSIFSRSSKLQILSYTHTDWAGCVDTRKSTSKYCFFLRSSLILWTAKKQQTISRSSSKAEYRALSITTCELIWVLNVLWDLQVLCLKPPIFYCDNQSVIHIAFNPVFNERTKHFEINCHMVTENVQ